jgi:hypothetical protein
MKKQLKKRRNSARPFPDDVFLTFGRILLDLFALFVLIIILRERFGTFFIVPLR